MGELQERDAVETWVCPNDRQLSLRARLNSGWSVHSNVRPAKKPSLSKQELNAIQDVIRRAEAIDKTEQMRVGKMVDRLDGIRKNASGDGVSRCVLCGEIFGFAVKPGSCVQCFKAVCTKCTVETLNGQLSTVTLCKICSEHRELWKKSGAWFFRGLPKFILPSSAKKSNVQPGQEGVESDPTVTSVSPDVDVRRTAWAKPNWESDEDDISSTGVDELDARREPEEEQLPPPSPVTPRSPYTQPKDWFQFRRPSNSSSAGRPSSPNSSTLSNTSIPVTPPATAQAPPEPQKENAGRKMSVDSKSSADSESEPMLTKATSQEAQQSHSSPVPKDSTLGWLEFAVWFEPNASRLMVHIVRAGQLPPMDMNGLADPYVKLHLLPGHAKSWKLRTRTVYATLNPEWDQILPYIGMAPSDLINRTLRLRVYDEDRIGAELVGECRIALDRYAAGKKETFLVPLQKAKEDEPAAAETGSPDRGKMRLKLVYHSSRQMLAVTVVSCAHLLPMDTNGFSDPFVKVQLSGEKRKWKTSVRKRTLNPEFNEEFHIPLVAAEHARRRLYFEIWDHDVGKKNDYLGAITLSSTTKCPLARQIWGDVFSRKDKSHERWLPLQDQLEPSS